MNEEDLRDCFAMFALCGYMTKMGCNPLERGSICDGGAFANTNAEAVAKATYIIADAMLEARRINDDDGIVSIKKRARKPK